MNLHGIVSNAIATVNPFRQVVISINTGSTTDASGKRQPTYADPQPAMGQIQALTQNDIFQLEGMNIQGVHSKMYIQGNISGLVRVDRKGGDIVQSSDGKMWLVSAVLEAWPDWCAVALILQDN